MLGARVDCNVSHQSAIFIRVLVGLAVLLYGRRLFWLFVGAVGFMVAITLVEPLLTGIPEWQVLIAAPVAGLRGDGFFRCRLHNRRASRRFFSRAADGLRGRFDGRY